MLDGLYRNLQQLMSRSYVRFFAWQKRIRGSVENWQEDRLHNLNRRTLLIITLILVLYSALYIGAFRPPSNFPTEQYVTIEEGDSLATLALSLEEEGIVRSAWWLEMIVRLRGGQRSVKAGDYLFAKPVSTFSIARRITTGVFGLEPISITIPEGSTVADMTVIYAQRLFKFDPERFFANAIDYEGYLYPDTYYFLPNVREDEVIRVMRDNFDRQIAEFRQQIEESPYTLHEILTLASIIEKEAWNDEDRQLISGVLHNRLSRNMLLQVDATFVYTHAKGTYDITIDELTDENNPYNTYVYKGLPPGPIAAVGRSSLYAALNPTPSEYLFYLADRRGTTYYSVTYEEHLAKKRRYVD
ncbi:hypothetical protein CL652_02970 [bacterium]|nr:hypothetical protein [bacterium]|tara:strand:- start:23681 stop:24751 length:1071 start_codon:yes stop_codon:yes gene_type:complete